jgi:hypothetical protein
MSEGWTRITLGDDVGEYRTAGRWIEVRFEKLGTTTAPLHNSAPEVLASQLLRELKANAVALAAPVYKSRRERLLWFAVTATIALDVALCWSVQKWEMFGPILSGAATLIGASLAVRGFERWQDRLLTEQQAKVATDLLHASLELCHQLRLTITEKLGDAEPSPYDVANNLIDMIWKRGEPFQPPRAQAQVYLSEATNVSLDELWRLVLSVNGALCDLMADCDRYGFFEVAGIRILQNLDALNPDLDRVEASLKTNLRRYVHFEH